MLWVHVVTATVFAALAMIVVWAAPSRAANRRFAAIMGSAVGYFLFARLILALVKQQQLALVLLDLATVCALGVVVSTILFAGTVPIRMANWVRTRPGQVALAAAVASLVALKALRPEAFITSIELTDGGWVWERGPLARLVAGAMLGAFVFMILCLLGAFRRCTGFERRKYATMLFVLALGIAPAASGWVVIVVLGAQSNVQAVFDLFSALLFAGGFSYAILRHQIFGLQLRIKVGISRATVAATIGGAAFLGSELIEQAFNVDQTLPAVLLAAGVGLGVRPIALMAERIADRLMPGVEDTTAYRRKRAAVMYQAAYEAALAAHAGTEAEREELVQLATRLGLTPSDVREIENRVGHAFDSELSRRAEGSASAR